MDSRLLAFIGIAALVTITPGPDMALVTRNALSSGRRAALLTTLGVNNGLLAWAVASGAGLAALLSASATAFTVLKLVGAAYLLLLGLRTLWQTRARAAVAPEAGESVAGGAALGDLAAYRQGLLSNLLNPKVGIFYATLLPQFIGPGDAVFAKSLLLGCLHITMGITWLSLYAYLVTRAGDLLRRPAVRRAIERVTGAVLIGFGVRLAAVTR